MRYVKKALEGLRDNMVNSTAVLVCTHPIYAFLETGAFKMTHQVSINARYNVTMLMYGGLGLGLTYGRKLSRQFFNITDKTNEWTQFAHDALYTLAVSLPINPPFYLWSGETDVKKIAIGTVVNSCVSGVIGPMLGYFIDVYRDLVGIEKCERPTYPKTIKSLRPTIKKSLAAGLVAASIGLTAGVYSLTPDKEDVVQIENASNSPQDQAKELYSNDF
ncbi:MAG: hypothetical protein HY512_01500 [Candidatus Aenigmarchaeota archaeon]|nr:hypothetical protein [Candidatus Aenigmarchaeota archaeon]